MPLPGGPPPLQPAAAPTWFYDQGGQPVGPLSAGEVQRLIALGQLRPDSSVWRDGMAEWLPANRVAEFSRPGGRAPSSVVGTPGGVPKPVKTAGLIWIIIGLVILANAGMTLVKSFNAQEKASDAAAFGGPCASIFIGLVALVFISAGRQSMRGTARDTLGNGLGSVIFGLLQLVGGLAAVAVELWLQAVVALVAGATLTSAGILALANRGTYKAWKRGEYRPAPGDDNTMKFLGVVFGVVAVLAGVTGFFAVPKINAARDRVVTSNHLKLIALGLHSYENVNNKLPPVAICDADGKPLLSWRVAILPFNGQDGLYKQFKLDEPWDSPHNKKLLEQMPREYALRTDLADETTTPFRVFVGNGAAFEPNRPLTLGPGDFPDGTSNVILVVEANERVPWTKPDELTYEAGRALPKLGKSKASTFSAALADGAVKAFRTDMPEADLRIWLTRNNNQTRRE
jgi:hypothetical protein